MRRATGPSLRTLFDMGKEVARLRKEKGWTQQQLGAQVGMGQSTVARLESGKMPEFGSTKVLRLLAALGVELATVPMDTTQRAE
jgi:HTH-type transcriptional regulator / antitoxin HipB